MPPKAKAKAKAPAAKGKSGGGSNIPVGTHVTWHYRSAIGHGTVVGVAKQGTTSATTKYRIRQSDHHPGEPAEVAHYGKALTRGGGSAKK